MGTSVGAVLTKSVEPGRSAHCGWQYSLGRRFWIESRESYLRTSVHALTRCSLLLTGWDVSRSCLTSFSAGLQHGPLGRMSPSSLVLLRSGRLSQQQQMKPGRFSKQCSSLRGYLQSMSSDEVASSENYLAQGTAHAQFSL